MTFWEVLSLIGFGATVLGAWLTASSYYNGRATRALIRDFAEHFDRRHLETQQLTRGMEERHRELLDRMDQRANDRHRDTIEAIRTLRA